MPLSRMDRYSGLTAESHLRQLDADMDIIDAGVKDIVSSIESLKARANGILVSLVVGALLLAANLAVK